MRDHLKAFLQHLKLNRHLSPHTVRAYESDITQYLAFVAAETGTKMSQLTPSDLAMTSVRAHIAGLNAAGAARSSVGRKLSALKTFVRYLRREEVHRARPDRDGGCAQARSHDSRVPQRAGDHAPDRNAEYRRSARPPRSGHPRIVLCLRSAVERTGGDRSRGCEPERPHGARHGQGPQGTAAAVQSKRRRCYPSLDEGSCGASCRPAVRKRPPAAAAEAQKAAKADDPAVHQLSRHAPDRTAASTGCCADTSRSAVPAWASALTRCGTPLPRICCSEAPTYAPSRSCSATPRSAPHSATRMSMRRNSSTCTANRILALQSPGRILTGGCFKT